MKDNKGTPNSLKGAVINALEELEIETNDHNVSTVLDHMEEYLAQMFSAGYMMSYSVKSSEECLNLFKLIWGKVKREPTEEVEAA